MSLKDPACGECGDARHVWDKDRKVWLKCECLTKAKIDLRYRKAGLPRRYDELGWADLMNGFRVTPSLEFVGTAQGLVKGVLPSKWILIHGRPSHARNLAVVLVARSLIRGGRDCQLTNLATMIDAEFQPGRGDAIYRMPSLAIECGHEPSNKFNRVVLERALRDRWERQQFTCVYTEADPSRLGSIYQSPVVEEAVREQFLKVKVGPRE